MVGILYQFIFDWRYLYLCVVFPGLVTISYYWAFPGFIPYVILYRYYLESLHWLITHKKSDEVHKSVMNF
jgi:hypothetical protein